MPATVADAFTDASASIGTAAAQVVQTKCLSDDNDFWLTTNQTVGGVQYGHYKVADLPANKSFSVIYYDKIRLLQAISGTAQSFIGPPSHVNPAAADASSEIYTDNILKMLDYYGSIIKSEEETDKETFVNHDPSPKKAVAHTFPPT